MITQSELKKKLIYCHKTGEFFKVNDKSGKNISVGWEEAHGYKKIYLYGKKYYAHRLAWLYIYGEWPENIDHIDGNRLNNTIENLRNCNKSINNQNQKQPRSDNKTGYLGVYINSKTGQYIAQIRAYGKNIVLGRYLSPELASNAYISAKRKMHDGCTI